MDLAIISFFFISKVNNKFTKR